MTGTVRRPPRRAASTSWHLSLSHDGDMAIAFVVATAGERDDRGAVASPQVRAAEEALFTRVADGTLMQRAARGLRSS